MIVNVMGPRRTIPHCSCAVTCEADVDRNAWRALPCLCSERYYAILGQEAENSAPSFTVMKFYVAYICVFEELPCPVVSRVFGLRL